MFIFKDDAEIIAVCAMYSKIIITRSNTLDSISNIIGSIDNLIKSKVDLEFKEKCESSEEIIGMCEQSNIDSVSILIKALMCRISENIKMIQQVKWNELVETTDTTRKFLFY